MEARRRNPDQLELDVIRAIDTLCDNPSAMSWSDTQWTRETKNALARLGKSKHYWVYASGCDFADGGEWLYDLCWLAYSEETLVGAPLIAEIEWYFRDTDVDDDFQKLVLARCDNRVMLFSPRRTNETRASVDALLTHISRCRHTVEGDKYLFGCWSDSQSKFDWFAYEAR